MLCTIIKGPSFKEAQQQIACSLALADIVELRLDYFESIDLNALQEMKKQFAIPMIFSLRSHYQGGNHTQPESHRLAIIEQLATLNPDYLDLEDIVPIDFISNISTRFPHIKIILSHHNSENTPPTEVLEQLFEEMKRKQAAYYKIAVTARHSLDPLRILSWAHQRDSRLIAICMGIEGQLSRILGPVIGNPITYAALDETLKSASGQLTADVLLNRYRHKALNPHTKIYGLIGSPITQSISDLTHNGLIETRGWDAVYVKIDLSPEVLPEFFTIVKTLPFNGLSVTMPLKEHVIPYLDEIASQTQAIGAVNTLCFEQGKIKGFNTDGIGALNAIEKVCNVKDKHIVVLGAGGAAKAIAFEAIQRRAKVTILNRDSLKAQDVAQRFSCLGRGLDEIAAVAEEGYDILINCNPVSLPIDPKYILPKAILMDIKTKPQETPFLLAAQEKGCRLVYGYQMFIQQAVQQFNLWFKDTAQTPHELSTLEEDLLRHLPNEIRAIYTRHE